MMADNAIMLAAFEHYREITEFESAQKEELDTQIEDVKVKEIQDRLRGRQIKLAPTGV